jgi:WD40 repeat protein
VRFENADLSCFLCGPQGQLYIGVHGKGFQYLQEVATDRPNRAVTGAVDQLCSLALSSDGAVIVTGSERGAIQFWDTASGLEAARLDTHRSGSKPSAVLALAISGDGTRLASASDDRRLWLHARPYGYPRPY